MFLHKMISVKTRKIWWKLRNFRVVRILAQILVAGAPAQMQKKTTTKLFFTPAYCTNQPIMGHGGSKEPSFREPEIIWDETWRMKKENNFITLRSNDVIKPCSSLISPGNYRLNYPRYVQQSAHSFNLSYWVTQPFANTCQPLSKSLITQRHRMWQIFCEKRSLS